jgi:predicted nuclease with TOPRIM domain
MTTKEEIKQRLMDLTLELNDVCDDEALNEELKTVWDKLSLLHESAEKLDDGWRDATKELPELIQGKDYSEQVFAKVKGCDEIEVMCIVLLQDGGISHLKWANCYGDIYGDGYYDDEYEVTEWKYIRF